MGCADFEASSVKWKNKKYRVEIAMITRYSMIQLYRLASSSRLGTISLHCLLESSQVPLLSNLLYLDLDLDLDLDLALAKGGNSLKCNFLLLLQHWLWPADCQLNTLFAHSFKLPLGEAHSFELPLEE